MSEAPSTTAPAGESEAWREKFKRQYMQLEGLGFQSMMLDKIMQQNKMAREIAQRTADGTLGQPAAAQATEQAEDEMGIRIGDEVNHHYPAAAPPAATPPATQQASGMSSTAKFAAAAALLAAGIGPTALTSYLLLRWPTAPATAPAEPVASQPPSMLDRDTQYGLEVSSSAGPPAGPAP